MSNNIDKNQEIALDDTVVVDKEKMREVQDVDFDEHTKVESMLEDHQGDELLQESLEAEKKEIDEEEVISYKLPFSFARDHHVLLKKEGDDYCLYYNEETDVDSILEVKRSCLVSFRIHLLSKEDFNQYLTDFYQNDASAAQQFVDDISKDSDLSALADDLPETEDLLDAEGDAPIIRLINALLAESIKVGASDLHFETYEKELVVRFRVDGILQEALRQNRKIASMLISRIKVMSKMDIAEKRIPQDGRISLKLGGRAVDVRVSTMPSSRGERVVMRLLDKSQSVLTLKQLGMSKNIREAFSHLIRRPHGILLVTGPTCSGKSTTLYAGLTEINDPERNILTVEDPIEFEIEGIGQTQVNNKVDMTFARGLRAMLRQDPDVVMVGEIRDLETAQIAVQASLTGHLVISTLHTNTAAGAVTRMQDMGVEPFLLSSSLLGVLAQRLVRGLCQHCKEAYTASDRELKVLGKESTENITLYKPKGCEECNHLGYKGRTGIHELLVVDDKVRQLISDNVGEYQIEKVSRELLPSIRDDGFSKVLQGLTTLEEVLRVTKEE